MHTSTSAIAILRHAGAATPAAGAGDSAAEPGFAALFALGLGTDPGQSGLPGRLPGLLPTASGRTSPSEAEALPAAAPDAAMLSFLPLAPDVLARLEAQIGNEAIPGEPEPSDAPADPAALAATALTHELATVPLLPQLVPTPSAVSPAPTSSDEPPPPGAAAMPPGTMPDVASGPRTRPASGTAPESFAAATPTAPAATAASLPAVSADAAARAPARNAPPPTAEPAAESAAAPAVDAPAPGGVTFQAPPLRSAEDVILLRIAPPVNHPEWAGEVDRKLTWMVGNARHEAELVINPPQLGRIEVSLVVQGDQVSASFASPHQVVREALETALVRLRESLAESGIRLGDTHVGHEPRRDGQPDHLPRHGAHAARGEAEPAMPPRQFAWRPAARGLIDLFA